MKIYLVGGAVRDELLGLPVKERDWVVVGAQIEEMLRLGYQQVGKDFPVFLHPKTHEEYALARMERKIGPGYKGFMVDSSPDVSLESDLLRRDLTINAMAQDIETDDIIDPYHGQEDLKAKILRHVSPAFAEDPVRILRVGRFLARYGALGFTVAPETQKLMQTMVASGEVNALVAERVWKELERAMSETHPENFFAVLQDCHALPILFPELKEVVLNHQENSWIAFLEAISLTSDTAIRLAVLMHDLPEAKQKIDSLFNRFRLPNHYKTLAKLTAQYYQAALTAKDATAEDLLALLTHLDVFRREERLTAFLLACKAIAKARHVDFDEDWLREAAAIAKNTPVQDLVTERYQGQAFADALRKRRLENLIHFIYTRKQV